LLSGQEVTSFLFRACVIPNLSAALIRRSCLDEVGRLSSNYRVCCDWDLFFRIADRHDVAYVAEPLNHFRQHRMTIRSRTTDRVLYDEYLRLLLGQLRQLSLSFHRRWRARIDVMYLWSVHLFAPRLTGLADLPHHARVVLQHDPPAFFVAPIGLIIRFCEIVGKVLNLIPRSEAVEDSREF
jgi:hypothetical protein